MNSSEVILSEFDSSLNSLKAFESQMQKLITHLLESKQISVHNISSRTKERDSLEKKILSKNKYTALQEVTDIVGVRIITFFEDEVDIIAKLITEEFKIDEPNSIDKRVIEYDKFGYASLHYVAGLNAIRCKLLEYKSYKNYKFEIQIRSILQHAWAEIEHDIGYKSKAGIPDIVKRNFSRVAALLETSDLEFTKLRNKLTDYESEIEQEITTNAENVDINSISLNAFSQSDKIIDEIDKLIVQKCKGELLEDRNIDTTDINKLKYLGINNIEQLSKILKQKKTLIASFGSKFLLKRNPNGSGSRVGRGISLFYLCYVYAVEKLDKEDLQAFVEKFWGSNFASLPAEITKIYEEVSK